MSRRLGRSTAGTARQRTLLDVGLWPTAALRTVTFDPAGHDGAARSA